MGCESIRGPVTLHLYVDLSRLEISSLVVQNRDHDGNGLCEFGSTNGTRLGSLGEGMDNAVL